MDITITRPSSPGVTDDERRTIAEMMTKGSYASITLANADLDGGLADLRISLDVPTCSVKPKRQAEADRLADEHACQPADRHAVLVWTGGVAYRKMRS